MKFKQTLVSRLLAQGASFLNFQSGNSNKRRDQWYSEEAQGWVPGPSGMTGDHGSPSLGSERDAESFCHMCEEFARTQVANEVQALRMGRMTALQKSSGGIRGIVVGDFIRRLVARTIAQQLNPAIEQATSPFHFALTTKSGCECIAHIAQALTDLDANATLLSVDGIGAFDLISWNAMLQGLLEVEGGGSVLSFVRQFYGSPSTYWWDDESQTKSCMGRAGEQGDPLLPALYALGHKALVAVSERLLPTERLLTFHDELFVLCGPPRVADAHVQQALWEHSRFKFITVRPSSGIGAAMLAEGVVHSQQHLGRSTRTQSCGAEILNSLLPRGESLAPRWGILSMCGLFSRTRPEPMGNCWSGSQRSAGCLGGVALLR